METVQRPEDNVDSQNKPDSQTELDTAKVFMSGNSQAVRLPKAYRFAADIDTLEIKKVGDSIVLTPIHLTKNSWLERVNTVFDILAAEHNESEAENDLNLLVEVKDVPPQERETIVFHNDWF